MRLTKVRGNDAEEFPIATEQRRGLYCAKASGGSNRTVRCKIRIGQNVFYDDPLGALEGAETGSAAFLRGAEMIEEILPQGGFATISNP